MKVFNGFMMVVFVVFAALQYNDPDPEKWVPLYLYAALICWWAIRQRFYPLSYWLGFLVYGGYAIYKVFDNKITKAVSLTTVHSCRSDNYLVTH